MHLEYLADYKHFIPIITNWFYDEWKHLNPSRTKEEVIKTIKTQLNKDELPTIFIGLDNFEQLIGTVSLRTVEMENFKHLSPWLSSLYVPVEKRRQGIGTLLIKKLLEKANEYKIETMYLFTEKSEDWYAQMGWETFKKVMHRGYPATIMKITI